MHNSKLLSVTKLNLEKYDSIIKNKINKKTRK